METQIKPYSKNNYQVGKVLQLEKGKVPPQAIELEEAILGAMMIDPASIDELFQVFSSEEVFYRDNHKFIFRAIKTLVDSSKQVDLLTVSAELRIQGNLDYAGGDFYLIGLTQKVASGAHINYHAHIVLQSFMRRKVIQIASESIEAAYDDTIDVFSLLDRMDTESAMINDVVSRGKSDMSFSEALEHVMKNVEVLSNAKDGEVLGVKTGFTKLDRHFGGWQPSDFVVIGARPGMGKTAFTINTMIAAAKDGVGVGFVSMEMSTIQLAIRSVAVNSNFHLNQLTKTGFDKVQYFNTLRAKVDEMKSLPIYIDERPALTIGEIKRKARLLKRKYDIKELIVDYIQLAGGDDDIRKRTGQTSQGLKALAKELNITVIGLAQLSRAVESTSSKRPMLNHLKESGDIEQDADIVAFLFRPAYYGMGPDESILSDGCNTEFIVAKYRAGGLGTLGLHFDENKTKFTDQEVVEEISHLSSLPYMNPGDVFDVDVEHDNGIDF
ncbi:replicative DNA helicase [Flavobacterium aquiphilum]|uniref:replicative DNA helicase n=1 Tax=Flavobacterium aquiphilum TaxID=3003261 RepID=UPI002481897D|nr:replicative DNA helicase [Flavobacterium aquiphilum]